MENNETQKEIEWKKPIEIEEGSHTGTISRVSFRDDPYEYFDVFIKLDFNQDIELKYGCPAVLSENSKFGRLFIAFGENYEEGKKLNPTEVLVGKKVKFMTMMKKSKDGREFAEIISDSVKPTN